MAFDQTRRLRRETLQSDRAAYVAVQTLPNYKAANLDYTPAALAAKLSAMDAAWAAEIHAQNALNAARDAAAAAEWAFHNAILGTKRQVIALYGPDSDAVQAVGMKKKSERKRPVRRKKALEEVPG